MTTTESKAENHSGCWIAQHLSRVPQASLLRCLAPIILCAIWAGYPSSSPAQDPSQHASVSSRVSDGDLPQAWPEEVGVNSRNFVDLSRWIREQKLDVRSFLVIKDGKLVFERYSGGLTRDHNYELYSITKGVTSLVAGQLIGDGRVHLDDKVGTVLGKWRPDLAGKFADKQDIELQHVLTMSTGLRYEFKPPNDPIYYEAPDRLRLAAITQPVIPPGSVFEYMDINPVIAAAMLSAGAGMPIEKYADERLFQPLGMRNYAWERADSKGLVSSGWGLRLRAVDMGKIGMLMLNGGRWQGKQIVPEAWIRQATSPGVVPYFGYYWWIKNVVEGGVEGGPEPEFDTMGFKGQFIVVLPERNAVVVMTSMLPIEGGLRDAKNLQMFRYMISHYVLPALTNKDKVLPSEAARTAVLDELRVSASTAGTPGAPTDLTDTPRR